MRRPLHNSWQTFIYLRITYGENDHGYFSGGGEGTLEQLRRLILEARGEPE